jgi:hypothetical protein
MSEYQYVGFRAIDAPLSDRQLEYMETQSSRAEITRWSFDNQYHYGDFRGNPVAMLRRGYDVHLHYANFGIRKVMFRLPYGLPASKALCFKYVDSEHVMWEADPDGPAGILSVSAMTEPGRLDEIWDVDEYLDRLVGVRQELIVGDLRPLFAAWLCGCQSDEVEPESQKEPPVPAGLEELSEAIVAMLEFFDVSQFVLAAAAESSPRRPDRADRNVALAKWLKSIPVGTLREWMFHFLVDEPMSVRADCLQAFRQSCPIPDWPVAKGTRALAELIARADQLAEEERLQDEKRKQQARRRRLRDMAKSPQKYLDEVSRHVALRGRDHYEEAAQILSDLREAIGGTEGEKITRKHAAHLKEKYPTLKMLTGSLRRKGLL